MRPHPFAVHRTIPGPALRPRLVARARPHPSAGGRRAHCGSPARRDRAAHLPDAVREREMGRPGAPADFRRRQPLRWSALQAARGRAFARAARRARAVARLHRLYRGPPWRASQSQPAPRHSVERDPGQARRRAARHVMGVERSAEPTWNGSATNAPVWLDACSASGAEAPAAKGAGYRMVRLSASIIRVFAHIVRWTFWIVVMARSDASIRSANPATCA